LTRPTAFDIERPITLVSDQMKLFECQNCGQALYFENTSCESCGLRLGYLPWFGVVSALQETSGDWRALAHPEVRYRLCANAQYNVCNWLVRADQPEQYCAACRHNRTIPDLSQPDNLRRWDKIESAKHRLFYSLLRLRLPLATKAEDPDGLAFDFIADQQTPQGHIPVMTGHDNGLITLNLAEADDPERERQRSAMGEPYRALLGHFRHEIAHYYWDRLITNTPKLTEFREIFGDEQQNYGAALQNHYANGPSADWPEQFVSAYASSHPWEDFAETWAHYFHMVDTLETAGAFGLSVRPKVAKGSALTAKIDFDPYDTDMNRIIDAWLPLTFAVNSINRSMGLQDLYPFLLGPAVIVKLAFVHGLTHAGRNLHPQGAANETIRAIASGLRRNVGLPGPT
jgi:hypothetical protein